MFCLKSIYKHILICCAVIAAFSGVSASEVRHIALREGLSSRQVYDLDEDKDGYVWMYTNSGLERYDGYRFRHYSLDPSEESNDHIAWATTMKTTDDGGVWIASKSGSVYHYNKVYDRFERRYRFDDPAVTVYNFDYIGGDSLFVAANDGIYLCVPETSPVKVGMDGVFVTALTVDDSGLLYAGTDNGVYIVDPASGFEAKKIPGTEGVYVKSLAIASDRLYVGPFSSSPFAVSLSDRRIHRLPFHVPPIPVNAITNLGADTLLLGVDGAGVYMIDSRDGHLLRHYRDGDGTEYELSGSTVSDVMVDHDGGIWISTSHNGVNYIPAYTENVTVLNPVRGNSQSLLSNHVNVVFEDSKGERWFGTDKGVSRYNPATGRWTHYLEKNDYSANVILSINEDSDGNIWIGSYGEGASKIDRNTGKVTALPAREPGTDRGVDTRYLFTSYNDKDGNVWLGGINGLLTRYNPKSDSYSYSDEDCISLITYDNEGGLLFSGNRGVGIYDKANDSITWVNKFDSITIRYPVRSLFPDSDSETLWIGTTGEGLIRYNRSTKEARRFTSADGLSSNTIYAVLRDSKGTIWVSTESDLYRYNPEAETFRRFTSFFGTDQLAFNPGGAVMSNGDMILPSPDGCIMFNPTSDLQPLKHERLKFTNILLNGRNVEPGIPGSPLDQNIDLTGALSLDHSYNNIAIDFAVINIESPRRIDYEYMLEGYDKAFRKSDASLQARYSGLEPGKYNFKVRAIDLYSDQVIDERVLPVTIRQPWWLSVWAKILYVLITGGVLVLAVSYVRNRQRERHIERHIRTLATIAHDIRTPMSMIRTPLMQVEQESGLSDSGHRNLTIAKTGIDKTLKMLGDMIDMPSGLSNTERLAVDSCDIRQFLKVKCEEFMPLAIFKGLELNCSVDDNVPQRLPIDYDKLSHVVDNLLSNAIKYTFEGSVTIGARLDGSKKWVLSVADTGTGIPKGESRRIFKNRHRGAEALNRQIPGTGLGLVVTRRMVLQQKGKIAFESEPGKGTVFRVTLPTEYAERYYSASHTEAIKQEMDNETGVETAKSGRPRIYVVDDDDDIRNYLVSSLSDDYDVEDSSDSVGMLERIRTESPDLVIADVMMPRLRGDELCRMIKTDIATSHIPVILLSGLTAREDVVSGLESHADDYVVKPFDIVLLKARIRNIIKNRRQLSQRMLQQDCKPEEVDFSSELDRQFMTSVMDAVNETISDSEFSVGDLCARLGMSRTSVYNKIRSITGQSVNEYIRIVRLNRAKELLGTGQYNVSEVAYMVGFSDPKYFSTCFKKQFGISPSKYYQNPQ